MILVCLTCALAGAIISVVCTLLFFQGDKTWIKIVSPIIGISGTGAAYILVKNIAGVNDQKAMQVGVVILLFSIVIVAPITLYFLCKVLKDQDGNQTIRVRDILLGQKKFIDTYYETRAEELKEKFYSRMIEEEKEKINSARDALQIRERDITSRELKLQSQIQDKVAMNLPMEAYVPMTNDFLGQFPDFIESLAKYINDVGRITSEYIDHFDQNKKYNLLYSYFLAICSFTMEDLFGTSSRNVRIHFRILDGDKYIKFVAIIGQSIYEDDLKPMPLNRGMIRQSYCNQTSLIKSLNIQYDEQGTHRKIWEDYMTLTFCDIKKDENPFISMGISVKNKEKFKHLLYFLNFYKIENFLQDRLKEIDKVYHIVDTIETNFSRQNG